MHLLDQKYAQSLLSASEYIHKLLFYANGTIYSTAGSDYDMQNSVIRFSVEETEASGTVRIINDNIIESTERFSLTLSSTQPHVKFGNRTADFTIHDDDSRLK